MYGFTIEHLFIGDQFNPEVGFLKRGDMRRTFTSGRISPRLNHKAIRRLIFSGNVDYILNASSRLDSRNQDVSFSTEFQSSDVLTVSGTRSFDRLVAPFRIAPGVTIPIGGYSFDTVRGSYAIGPQKQWTGSASIEHGAFYGGHQTNAGFSSGRLAVMPKLSVEPSFSVNWVDLPYGFFTTQIYRSRLNYTFSPRMFVAGLLQYNSSTNSVSTNVRLRWEYAPGSELFVVLTEERPTDVLRGGFSQALNRAFVVKVNRLWRF